MKKLSKLLALVLALALCVSFATACSNDAEEENNNANNENENVENNENNEEAESDLQYVLDKGTLVVGITDFAPMDYRDDNGEWIGFDADMARAYAEDLGVDVEFVEINWDNKAVELETKAIDVVWNGMTINDEVKALMSVSNPYCNNAQVVVVNAEIADQITDVDSIKELSFAAENGSAGAGQLDLIEGLQYIAVDTQAKALLEVASGSVDACVIDALMAAAMIGEGTSYPDLVYTIGLNSEEYGVGFRMGSDLVADFNEFWTAAYEAGTVTTTAETYGVQASIIEY